MLSGDVETNPGPDLTEIFNQLENPADDIRAVKEERLADGLSDVYLYIRSIFVSLLLLCGDVEQNPGPSIEEMFEQLLDGQKSVTSRLDAIEEKLKPVEASVVVVNELGPKIATLEKTIQNLEKKLVELEDRSRRSNLIVYGVEEKIDESVESLTNEVVDNVFSTVLQVKVSSVERIHRLRRKQPNKQRPVILKLMDHREKTVLKNCSKLKGTNISASEYFAPATRC